MRASPRASVTALSTARTFGFLATAALLGGAGCAYGAPRQPERHPPARVLVVGLEQVALRTAAWVELHAWLASAARGSRATGDPELDVAVKGYADALAGDDRDDLLERTTRALSACEDERCARNAVTGSAFATPYLAALPAFLARHWMARAELARAGVEKARAAITPEIEPLVVKLAHDLGIDWPVSPPIVDVVSEAPEPGRAAPIRVLLAARGSCFVTERDDSERTTAARIVDCVLAHAACGLASKSEMEAALVSELGEDEGRRAYVLVAVHAAAMVTTAWEPKHASVLRRSAASVEPDATEWLADHWRERMRGESAQTFAKRFGAVMRTK
ncbi:MAG: hypothetical protein JWP87_3579 [Labilithrix sp.]|nr:hypothetical protein [Labilithrix sp.]